jgi:dTDP-4-dehydrorhamnose reductase
MAPKVLLLSGTGFLGSRLSAHFARRGLPFRATTRSGPFPFDLERPVAPQLEEALARERFTHGVLCAAMADIEECFRNPGRSRRVNLEGPAEAWALFARFGVKPVYFSTDMVFDCRSDFRREEEPPSPTTLYGTQKAAAEAALREKFVDFLIFRTSKMMSMDLHPRSILTPLAEAARGRSGYRAFRDQFVTPVFAEDVARAVEEAILGGASGTFHLAGDERLSRAELARRVCRALGADEGAVREAALSEAPVSEPRGPFHTLANEKARRELGISFTPLAEGLAELRKRL